MGKKFENFSHKKSKILSEKQNSVALNLILDLKCHIDAINEVTL